MSPPIHEEEAPFTAFDLVVMGLLVLVYVWFKVCQAHGYGVTW